MISVFPNICIFSETKQIEKLDIHTKQIKNTFKNLDIRSVSRLTLDPPIVKTLGSQNLET